ncbi:MAG: DUF4124 domain-containing protein [Gammaproteobacteria bacterium]|nr:DUF4124 domain-containing protein [Gammaproteobacteria bacterium]
MLTLMLLAQPVLADGISKWKDANGRVHFGDSPPADVSAEPLTVKPNVYEHPVLEPRAGPAPPASTVIMYSTVRCGYCRKARAYFKANGIAYTDYDVETSNQRQTGFPAHGRTRRSRYPCRRQTPERILRQRVRQPLRKRPVT